MILWWYQELVSKQPVEISNTEVQNKSKFHVIKKLNMFEDGPRSVFYALALRCFTDLASRAISTAVLAVRCPCTGTPYYAVCLRARYGVPVTDVRHDHSTLVPCDA